MKDSSDILFFFGAGASAPFGIPTMKQLVIDFRHFLSENGTDKEKEIFADIQNTLERELQRQIDLEDIFTVIDGLRNYAPDRMGLVSIYSSVKAFSKVPSLGIDPAVCLTLEEKFKSFVRERCLISDDMFDRISDVYRDLFNRIWDTTKKSSSLIQMQQGDFKYCRPWSLFTTNYDTCLEYYWREKARVAVNTCFRYDPARRTHVLDPRLFFDRSLSVSSETTMKLVKLHGSVSWMIEPDGTVTEEESIPARSLVGRRYVGPMMIYPIQQKELYVDPYISMFAQLNTELASKTNWLVIGYSFNDPVITEIFVRNSEPRKKILLVHPEADRILSAKLYGLKSQNVEALKYRLGIGDGYININQSLAERLV